MGEHVYTGEGVVIIQPPLQTAIGQQERNPFNLMIQSQPTNNQAGEIMIVSATQVEGVLFSYWHFIRDGDTVWGQLVDNHSTEAIAQNLITVPKEYAPHFWMPIPLAMANDTSLSGQVTAKRVSLHIMGNTVDLAHPFQIEIVASGDCMPGLRSATDGGGTGSSRPTPRPADPPV